MGKVHKSNFFERLGVGLSDFSLFAMGVWTPKTRRSLLDGMIT
jgi:hypothetical protein